MSTESRKAAAFAYFDHLGALARRVEAKLGAEEATLDAAIGCVIAEARERTRAGHKLMFVGNGGSAAIASHMATDYTKNGSLPAMAFNDASMLTCIGNDLGYENVFAFQIENHARPGDMVVAISSSGRSSSILKSCDAGRRRECFIVTLSGFAADNPLRKLGDVNFYVPSGEYGFVEVMHLSICHCILDFSMNLGRPAEIAEGKRW